MEAQQQPTAHGKRSGAARRKLKKEKQALEQQLARIALDDIGPKLPAELVYTILDLASFTPSCAHGYDPPPLQRCAFLRSASLVCQLWREEAQKLLWEVVAIHSNSGAKPFLLSADKGYETRKLDFSPAAGAPRIRGLDGKLVEQVIEASHGVRALWLGGIAGLRPEALFCSSLADTTKLYVTPTVQFTAFSDLSVAPLPPFRLDELGLDQLWKPTILVPLLLALLQSATFAMLQLPDPDTGYQQSRRGGHRPVVAFRSAPPFPALTQLEISIGDEIPTSYLLPILKRCTSLRRLRTNSVWLDTYEALGSQIAELGVHGVDDQEYTFDDELDLLRHELWSLSKLQVLELEPTGSATGRKAVAAECKARGIAVIWETRESAESKAERACY